MAMMTMMSMLTTMTLMYGQFSMGMPPPLALSPIIFFYIDHTCVIFLESTRTLKVVVLGV